MNVLEALPKYDNYINSDNKWLGNIPSHWKLKKFKYLTSIKKGKLPQKLTSDSDRVLPVYLSMEYLRGGVATQFVQDANVSIIGEGEILLLWDGSNSGEFIKSRKGVISSTVATINFNNINKSFAWYACAIVERLLRSSTVGMGIPHVDGDELKNSFLAMPPMAEQTTIANFLDIKTAQIDEAIAIKEKQIELLKERKQIIIQQAVTQGLNPAAPMKDSGVDWIGEIPEHWQVIRLKHLFNEYTVRTQTGVETLFSLRMELGLVPHDDVSDKHIPNENLIDYKIVEKGQLVMNRMRAAIGIFGIAKAYGLVSPDYAVFNISDEVVSEYYLTLFKLPLIGTQFRLASKGMGTGSSGFMRLYTDNFGSIKVPNPPKEEQKRLMVFINNENETTATAIHHLQAQINKLKEYKTTLINSAVTGKIKVPEVGSVIN